MAFYVRYVPTHGLEDGYEFRDEADNINAAVGIAARRIDAGALFVEIENDAGKVVITEKDLAGNGWVGIAKSIHFGEP